MKKVTTEDFIKRARQIHGDKFDYSKVEYVRRNQKVCIICPIHGEFWQTPGNHLNGNGCAECSGKKKSNTEEFIRKAKEIYGDKYDYSKVNYVNNETPVCIICPEHGEFWKRPTEHLIGVSGCPYCKGFYKPIYKVINDFKDIHKDKYDYSKVEYKGVETPVCIICPEHGEFWQTPYNHIKGHGCPKCAGVNKHTTNEFIERAKEIHNDIYDYSKVNYVNSHTPIKIICPEHGEFWQIPTNHLRGCGCPDCNTSKDSKISKKIETILEKKNIQYEKEKTFDWLINKSHMYLDFFIPNYNIAIECHGPQHFKQIDFFGDIDRYNEQIERDKLKYKLCSEHNIKIYYFTDIESEYFEKLYCNEDSLIEDICRQK